MTKKILIYFIFAILPTPTSVSGFSLNNSSALCGFTQILRVILLELVLQVALCSMYISELQLYVYISLLPSAVCLNARTVQLWTMWLISLILVCITTWMRFPLTFFLRTGCPVTALESNTLTSTGPCLSKNISFRRSGKKHTAPPPPPLVACVSLYAHHTKAASRKCSLPPSYT